GRLRLTDHRRRHRTHDDRLIRHTSLYSCVRFTDASLPTHHPSRHFRPVRHHDRTDLDMQSSAVSEVFRGSLHDSYRARRCRGHARYGAPPVAMVDEETAVFSANT